MSLNCRLSETALGALTDPSGAQSSFGGERVYALPLVLIFLYPAQMS